MTGLSANHRWIIVITVLVSLIAYVFELYSTRWTPWMDEKYSKINRYVTDILALLSFAVTVVIFPHQTPEIVQADISIQIEEVAGTLSAASDELANIQKELENRIQYVEELKKEAQIAENVISLSQAQVDAIRANLKEELEADSKRDQLQSILQNVFFYVLGSLPLIIKFIKFIERKFIKRKENSINAHLLDKYDVNQIEKAIKLLETLDREKN